MARNDLRARGRGLGGGVRNATPTASIDIKISCLSSDVIIWRLNYFIIYQFKNECIQAEVAELVKRYVPGSRSERFQVRTLALALIQKKKKTKKDKNYKKTKKKILKKLKKLKN